ncbi:uncharacterized protein DUF3558 [Lentzea atacamensis]|uniref:Uncharacterized protein DUF3558 n=2 Tax=Lentzea atacamensis TaxID=531938 RepID=A0ABX9DWA9_9PSEU|nr:uncharacterized protein DUF3558 [Lentzea atacamensis]
MWQRLTLTGLFAVALLAGACTVDPRPDNPGGDQQAEQQVEAGVPQEYRAKALAHARDRQIDACGLHDPAAAEKATGDKGDELVPGSGGLHECDLRLHKGEFNSTWRFNVEAGALFDASSRKSAAPENLGGLDIFVTEHDTSCEIAKPIDDDYAVVIVANAPSGKDKPAKAPCQVLREYVTALAPTWKELPKRGSGRTTPEFTLTRLDPCSAAATAMDMFAEPFLETSNPVTCTARSMKPAPPQQRPKGVGRDEVTVTWVMDDDPSKLVRAGDDSAREVTIDGRKAVLNKGSNGCTTYIVWDPDVSVVADNRNPEDETLTQQIRVTTATCDNAEQIAQKIVAKVAGK